MIKITKELKVEVSKPNIFQAIVAKQYDMNTRFLKVTLVDGNDIIDIPKRNDGSIKVVINAERPDGRNKSFEGEVNGDDDTVTVPLHSWMLEIEGTVICDISIIDTKADNNKKLTTTSFTLLVEKAAYGGDDITNDPQYDVLVSLLEAVPTAQQALEISNQALDISNQANSKYDACVEATNNANNVRAEIEAGGYIESLKELNEGGKFSFWVGTQAEYDAIEEPIANCFYIISDDKSLEKIENNRQSIEEIKAKPTPMKLLYDSETDDALMDTTLPGFRDYQLFYIEAEGKFETSNGTYYAHSTGVFYIPSSEKIFDKTWSFSAVVTGSQRGHGCLGLCLDLDGEKSGISFYSFEFDDYLSIKKGTNYTTSCKIYGVN